MSWSVLDSFLSRTQILLIQLMQDPKSIIEQGMAEYSGIFGSGTDSIIYGNSIYLPKMYHSMDHFSDCSTSGEKS